VRLGEHLEARHAREREPLVQRLAELHQQITTAAMLQSLRGSRHGRAEVGSGSGRGGTILRQPPRVYRPRGSLR
jgi:hypothetical protein